MGPTITLGAGLIGLAWWIISRTVLKRNVRAKLLPIDKPLTVREPDELSILCYNVLADNLVRSNANYNYADELYRSWEYRYDKLKDQMATLNADIICLQEVEISRWAEWKEVMDEMGYTGILLDRTTSARRSGRHRAITNATFYRSRRFRLCWEEHCSRVLGIGLTWFAAGGQEHKLYVVNVHLEGNPYKPAARTQQVSAILKAMEKDQVKATEESDVVFCGDFNSTRWNAPWHYLYCGRLEGGYTEPYYPDIPVVKETTAHSFALSDVYKAADAVPKFTARAPRRRTEADFIFASRHLSVAAVLRAVDPRLIPYVDRTLLPNKHYPSDHLPVGVVLLQPKQSETRLRAQPSARSHYSADMDSTFYEGTSGSVCSDNANNIELHASAENMDGPGSMPVRPVVLRSSRAFLSDTAMS